MVHMFRPEHLELVCPICRTKHNCDENGGWKPKFWKEFHYKTCACPNCEYEILIPTEELNSGHY
ncbi:MAG TPA: hypothetical protein ENL16_03530 [Candidatus Woesearchaeota archaeon]|nr:hypothetical protein [Candidatus Woesearchaeota archaeon]